MTVNELPAQPTDASVHTSLSPFSFDETVERLTQVITRFGLTLFAAIDHAGGARAAGLEMNDAEVLIFGHPRGGTPVMRAAPLAALDLPLRLLVWADDQGSINVSHHDAADLGRRFQIPPQLLAPLGIIDAVVAEALALADASASSDG
jgi:uncharacterized protein (DUF302 family)